MKNIGLYPRVQTGTAATRMVSQAGAAALVEAVRAAGLDRGMSHALGQWRKPLARHDPGKIVTDLAIALAFGGDCLADVAVLRAEPSVFGSVASDPTVSRLVDGAGATHELLSWLSTQRVQYSVGFSLPDTFATELALLDRAKLWQPAYHGHGQVRDGAFLAEVTGLLNLASWPAGMRVVIRKERPHPGAQLRITDHDGNRVTAFATNTTRRQLADLELRHRRRARCEDRIRISKDTGLRNLPLHDFDQNRIWLVIPALAVELTAWPQMLTFTDHPARRREPKRLRLLSITARITDHGRTRRLHPSHHAPRAQLLNQAIHRLRATAAPGSTHNRAHLQPETTGPRSPRTEQPRRNCHASPAQSPITEAAAQIPDQQPQHKRFGLSLRAMRQMVPGYSPDDQRSPP